MQGVQIDWQRASWQEACEAVSHLTDRLGEVVDESIFETVVTLNVLGLRTVQSCEGHLDHGACYPWVSVIDVDVQRPYIRAWQHVCALEEQARTARTQEAFDQYLTAQADLQTALRDWKRDDLLFARLISLLDTFYGTQHPAASPTRLLVMRHHPGLCRIRPAYAASADHLPEPLRPSYLARGQGEMAAFTQYLKRLWNARQDGEAEAAWIPSR